MAINPETIIVNECLIAMNTYATQAGLKAFRVNSGGVYDAARGTYRKQGQFAAKGISDIVVLARGGKTIWMEVKTPTGHLQDSQREFAATCERCGLPYEVVHSKEEALEVLRKYKIIGNELDKLGV